jgi:hypothetical protein
MTNFFRFWQKIEVQLLFIYDNFESKQNLKFYFYANIKLMRVKIRSIYASGL